MVMKVSVFCDTTPWRVLKVTDVSEEHAAFFFRVEE
jgi:hypothetical protein